MAASTSQIGKEQGQWLSKGGGGVARWFEQDGENEKQTKKNQK